VLVVALVTVDAEHAFHGVDHTGGV
jgi:hypothetical protein